MKLELQKGADNLILRTVSKTIQKDSKSLRNFVKEMTNVMLQQNGVGIAANQVGRNIRVFVLRKESGQCLAMLNPEILDSSSSETTEEEGCLSLPGMNGKVTRPQSVTVSYLDSHFHRVSIIFRDYEARIFQHEMDHLNRILFVDRVEKITR